MSVRLEPPHTVGGAIARRARRAPERSALVGVGERAISFGELASAIHAARDRLAGAGLLRTHRVGVVVPAGAAGAQLLVSIACNAVAVPIDPALDAAGVGQLIDATGIKALARLGTHGALELEILGPALNVARALRPTTHRDVALLLDAAGDPRRPRIAVTHRDLRALAGELGAQLALDKNDRGACLVPLHGGGIEAGLFAPLILGASVALPPNRELDEWIEVLQPTYVSATDRLAQETRRAAQPAASAPSEDLLELELCAIWRRLLQRDDIGLDEHFFSAGGDSLLATQMLLEIEALTGRAYPNQDLSMLTIRHIAQALRDSMPQQRGCITRAKAGSGTPLFFCHGDFQARGLYAHQLAALLPEDQPLYLLHPEQEPPAGTSTEDLAQRYLDEVLRAAAGSPVVLGGYCNGGYVAWHLAHLLRGRGVEVAALVLVETPSFNARPLVRRLAAALRAAGPRAHEQAMRAVWSLCRHGAVEFFRRLHGAARARLERSPAPGTPSWWLFVRSMATRYVPPPLDVDVYCIVSDDGPRRDTDPRWWRTLAASVTQLGVPGTHLSAVISHRRALAAALARSIGDATARRNLSAERPAPLRSLSRAAPAGQAG